MSKIIRTSGKVALPVLIVFGLIAALIGVQYFARSAPRPGPDPGLGDGRDYQPPPTLATFNIGPIDGLTTTWHRAPASTSIPAGTVAQFFQPALPGATVTWSGANEIARDDQGSTALCPMLESGVYVVNVEVIPAAGGAVSSSSELNAVDITAEEITVSPIDVWVDPVEIDETLPQDELNAVTMDYFFDPPIAALRDLGFGLYRTSVGRFVHMSMEVDPPGFAPLMEWRFDDQAVLLLEGGPDDVTAMAFDGMGLTETVLFWAVGDHAVDAGPVVNPAQIEIETYRVTITSHVGGEDIVPEGVPITFEAVTDPPGYEDDITWLSSTKYGTAYPVLGQGPVFVAEFNDTWGPWPGDPDITFQWLGVKADNAVFGQDQKSQKVNQERKVQVNHSVKAGPAGDDCTCEVCQQPSAIRDGWETVQPTSFIFGPPESPALPADFFGPGSDPFQAEVFLEGVPLPGLEPTDTLICRSANPFERCEVPPFPSPVTVDIEIVELSLRSVNPITVTFNGGQNPELWDVEVGLSDVAQDCGMLTATKTHCNGGTYTTDLLPVKPLFTFTQVGHPENVREFDWGLEGLPSLILSNPNPLPWAHDVSGAVDLSCPGSDFHLNRLGVIEPSCDCNNNNIRDKCDIEDGASDDNNNGIPDECEP